MNMDWGTGCLRERDFKKRCWAKCDASIRRYLCMKKISVFFSGKCAVQTYIRAIERSSHFGQTVILGDGKCCEE